MEGLRHILEERPKAFDPNLLSTSGRATLEGDGRLTATEVTSNEREQLFVCFTVDRRRLELSEPSATLYLLEQAHARARLDFDRDDDA